MYNFSILGFIVTIILQLIAARVSKEDNDRALDEEQPENGNIFFNISERINNIFLIIFIFSIIFAGADILYNNQHTDIQKTSVNNVFMQNIETAKLKYDIKDENGYE